MLKLNLACGANIFPGWINMDLVDMETAYLRHLRDCTNFTGWPEEQRVLAEALRRGEVEFRQHDVLSGIPFEDESVDAIYLGQMIEHLNPIHEAPGFLRECLRVLRKGASIRITTPDLNKILFLYEEDMLSIVSSEQPEFFMSASSDEQFSYLLFGACGEGCTRSNYEGHFMCYSTGSLSRALEKAGFSVTPKFIPQSAEGKTRAFEGTIDKGMSHSLAMEAYK